MGLDPTNTSYFEPTVHTYAKIEVEGNIVRYSDGTAKKVMIRR